MGGLVGGASAEFQTRPLGALYIFNICVLFVGGGLVLSPVTVSKQLPFCSTRPLHAFTNCHHPLLLVFGQTIFE